MNMDKNKNVKTVHIDNEEDLFKVLEGLGILAGFTPPSPSKNKKADRRKSRISVLVVETAIIQPRLRESLQSLFTRAMKLFFLSLMVVDERRTRPVLL